MKAKLANSIALDLGSSKIAAIAAYVDQSGDGRVLCQHLQYSEGIKSGVVIDVKAAENSIVGAIYAIENACEKNVQYASISLSGAYTKSYYIYHKVKLSSNAITKQDIQKLIQKALGDFWIKDYEIIHYFPIEFTLDEHNSIQDPVGMLGKELGCRLHIIVAESNMLLNIGNCMSKCQVEISNILLAIYASGLSCLTEDEQNLGSVIIDIGAKTTSFGVFLGKKLLYTGYVPVGGWHITSDIAKAYSISIKAAEKLKVLYGSAVETTMTRDSLINLEEMDPYSNHAFGSGTTTSNELAQIISPRVDEILELIKNAYNTVGVDHLIARRIVITGGSSMLRGMKERVSVAFDKQVRLGKPSVLPGFSEDCNPCVYSVAIGMVKIHALKQQKSGAQLGSYASGNDGLLNKIVTWLKENI